MRGERIMDQTTSSNGNHPKTQESGSVNVYADAVLGSQTREITNFELTTDPYANMVPSSGRPSIVRVDESEEAGRRKRSPLFVAISIVMVLLLILPPLAVVLSRLGI
jgi:hypothetical protein